MVLKMLARGQNIRGKIDREGGQGRCMCGFSIDRHDFYYRSCTLWETILPSNTTFSPIPHDPKEKQNPNRDVHTPHPTSTHIDPYHPFLKFVSEQGGTCMHILKKMMYGDGIRNATVLVSKISFKITFPSLPFLFFLLSVFKKKKEKKKRRKAT